MSRVRRWRAILVVAVIVIVVAVAVIFVLTRENGPQTATVTRGSLSVTIQTVGKLQPANPVTVRTSVDGAVQTIAVRVGDHVEQGDVLVVLDRRPFDDAIAQAEQQLENAEAALNLAEQAASATPTPQQEADRFAAQQNVKTAQQGLDQAKAHLAGTMILAPSAGTVLQVPVSSGARLAQGTPVVQRFAKLDDLEMSADIDEIDLPHVEPGMTTLIRFDAYPGEEIDGTITRISPAAQTTGGTTTFPATIQFKPSADMQLRPGMNADVAIQTALRQNVLLIPEQALRTVGKRTFVTVVSNGRQEEREIQTGLRSGGQVEVASGLKEGDRVVLH